MRRAGCMFLMATGSAASLAAQVTYSVFPAQSQRGGQPTRRDSGPHVTLTVQDSTVEYVVNAIARQAHLRTGYDKTNPAFAKRISVRVVDANAPVAFAAALKGTGLVARIMSDGETVVIRSGVEMGGQTALAAGMVVGRVTDSASGAGLGGAQVRVAGAKGLAAVTSDSGNFTLKDVPAGDQLLQVRLFGYRPAERTVTVVDGQRTTVRIAMAAVPTVLSGVVTTATGQQQRAEVGNDITVLNADSIMRVAPVQSVTDLLETRVPGLTVQRTSGIPGAPSRLRLRGASSILASDDPIVIIDGIRIYADQSGGSAGPNFAGSQSIGRGSSVHSGVGGETYAGPSALDQIDPNSIETIEVLKGPSATAIYGSDAANGVIVVTTKHGRTGPTHWSLTANQVRTTLPGDWPVNYYAFGHSLTSTASFPTDPSTVLCGYLDILDRNTCIVDSLVAYQALNDPRLDMLGVGWGRNASVTVSGGSNALTYSVTGSASNQTGYLHAPKGFTQLFDSTHGFAPPHWMTNPLAYTTYGGNGSVTAQLGRSGASLTAQSALSQSDQQQSALQTILSSLSTTYLPKGPLAASALADFLNNQNRIYERSQLHTLTFRDALTLNNWVPWRWLPVHATVGVDVRSTDNNAVIPEGYDLGVIVDSAGTYSVSRGTAVTKTLTAGAQLFGSSWLPTAVGLNVVTNSQTQYTAQTTGLPPGVLAPTSFLYTNGGPTQSQFNTATYGWYMVPQIRLFGKYYLNPGFRLDGGSASGTNASTSLFPKLDFSWVAVDRQGQRPLWGVLTLLRPRVAFGIAGVQPGPTEQYRLSQPQTVTIVGSSLTSVTAYPFVTLGNTQIHPERSRELEGGADAELWSGRVMLTLTGYDKLRRDAINQVTVAPSILPVTEGGSVSGSYYANVGDIRNRGVEATLTARLVDTRLVQWSVNGNVSHNSNVMLRSAFGSAIASPQVGYENRLVPGYPIDGLWARPILGYADANQDGVIEPTEVRVGDSLVYVGSPQPNYELSLATTVSLFNNRVSISTAADFQQGLTQFLGGGGGNFTGTAAAQWLYNPTYPQSVRAAVVASASGANSTVIGLAQTVSVLRWRSLSVSYLVPEHISRRLRVPHLSLALQGSNLALHTNYRGKDPNVNATAFGNGTSDTGQLPQPRLWSLSVRIGN